MKTVFTITPGSNASIKNNKCEEPYVKSYVYKTKGKEVINNEKLSAKISDVKRWVAISRYNIYWMKPEFGTKLSDVPANTQLLIIETNQGVKIVIAPLSYDEFTFTLHGGDTDDEICFTQNSYLPVHCTDKTVVTPALIAYSAHTLNDIIAGLSGLLKAATNNSFRLRIEKKKPDFLKKLGWCTWDAYYKEVDQEKIIYGLAAMADLGINPGYLIIDDGWLDAKGDYLNSFEPNTEKFDADFSRLIDMCNAMGVDIGVWHAFNGYWGGLNPDGKLADDYRLIKTENMIRPWEGAKDKPIQLYLIDPLDISRFYLNWYRHLKSLGVSMVKVDGQSAIEKYAEGKYNRTLTMRRYQEAMQAAGGLFFNNNVIHCMSHGSDVMANMLSTNVIRNSDDYFPGKPAKVQQNHIFSNAINAIYTSIFAIPDWDMFKSGMPEGDFHAAARAISGGPVYICDNPEDANPVVVNRLVDGDGQLLTPDEIALPLNDRIFDDCMHEKKLLLIRNYTKFGVVIGVFNVNVNGATITETINIENYLPFDIDDGAVYMKSISGITGKLPVSGKMTFKLKPMTYELVYFTSLSEGVAPLGLVNKYIGSAAIRVFDRDEGYAVMEVRTGGDLIIYSEKEPTVVTTDFEPVNFTYDEINHLITIDSFQLDYHSDGNFDDTEPEGTNVVINITFHDEMINKMNSMGIDTNFLENNHDLFLEDDPFDDDDEFIPHGKSFINGNIETEEDMLKMIKDVMERMEEGEDINQPLRLLPQKKGSKRKQ